MKKQLVFQNLIFSYYSDNLNYKLEKHKINQWLVNFSRSSSKGITAKPEA